MALVNKVTVLAKKVVVSADTVMGFMKNTVTSLTNTVNGFCVCIFEMRKERGKLRTSSATVTSQEDPAPWNKRRKR
jgi:hypothetical protein